MSVSCVLSFTNRTRVLAMSHVVTPAVLHQQMAANEVRQTRAGFQVIMPRDLATWSELGACKEIADLLKWRERRTAGRCSLGGLLRRRDR